MIGRIRGTVEEKNAPDVLIDVQGVGYDIQVPMTTYYALPDISKSVTLHTHHAVSETSNQLFGFFTKSDRQFFRMLIKVNGVGPKMAVSIMSIDTAELASLLSDNNVAALTKVPGVGKKTAERLVVDLKDKVKEFASSAGPLFSAPDTSVEIKASNQITEDAESALIALGYKPAEAAKAIAKIDLSNVNKSEDLIRFALKSMLPS